MIRVDPANPKGIVWIASYPKSGNTWLRIFLYQLMRIVGGYPADDHDLHQLDRSSIYEARLSGLFEQFLDKKLSQATWQEVASVRAKVHAAIAERAPSIAVVKTHNLLGRMLGHPIINMSVTAGAIYVVRNPLDVALSLVSHIDAPLDTAIAIMATKGHRSALNDDLAGELWGSWSEHVESWTIRPNPALLVIRYEDMIDAPTKHFASVADHLGQRFTRAQIEEAIALSSFDRVREQEAVQGFRERSEHADRFFRVGRAGQWREKLSGGQVKRIVDAHGNMMKRFGYLPDSG
jgi:hypothetical protein